MSFVGHCLFMPSRTAVLTRSLCSPTHIPPMRPSGPITTVAGDASVGSARTTSPEKDVHTAYDRLSTRGGESNTPAAGFVLSATTSISQATLPDRDCTKGRALRHAAQLLLSMKITAGLRSVDKFIFASVPPTSPLKVASGSNLAKARSRCANRWSAVSLATESRSAANRLSNSSRLRRSCTARRMRRTTSVARTASA
jgi:hypothetical protein